jgi:hypothetical protein
VAKDGNGLKPARVAFVCFENEIVANEFMKLYYLSSFKRIWLLIRGFFYKKNPYDYKDHTLYVTQAPEPSDIYWENIGVSRCHKILVRIFIKVCTIILFIIIFLIIKNINILA